MKNTGIIKRIIDFDDPIEIFVDREGEVILKKYSSKLDKQKILEHLEEIKSCIEMFYTRDNGMRIDEGLVNFAELIQVIHIDTLELIKIINQDQM